MTDTVNVNAVNLSDFHAVGKLARESALEVMKTETTLSQKRGNFAALIAYAIGLAVHQTRNDGENKISIISPEVKGKDKEKWLDFVVGMQILGINAEKGLPSGAASGVKASLNFCRWLEQLLSFGTDTEATAEEKAMAAGIELVHQNGERYAIKFPVEAINLALANFRKTKVAEGWDKVPENLKLLDETIKKCRAGLNLPTGADTSVYIGGKVDKLKGFNSCPGIYNMFWFADMVLTGITSGKSALKGLKTLPRPEGTEKSDAEKQKEMAARVPSVQEIATITDVELEQEVVQKLAESLIKLLSEKQSLKGFGKAFTVLMDLEEMIAECNIADADADALEQAEAAEKQKAHNPQPESKGGKGKPGNRQKAA